MAALEKTTPAPEHVTLDSLHVDLDHIRRSKFLGESSRPATLVRSGSMKLGTQRYHPEVTTIIGRERMRIERAEFIFAQE